MNFIWVVLGSHLGILGAVLGASWEPLLGHLRRPGGLLGRKARTVDSCSPSGALLRAVLGLSSAVVGASWAVWEPSWAVLELFWVPLEPSRGSLWGLLGSLGASEARKGENRKTVKNVLTINGFCLSGSWGPLGSLLGASFGSLGASWGPLGAAGSNCRFAFPLLGPF